jgi:magnesium transporter
MGTTNIVPMINHEVTHNGITWVDVIDPANVDFSDLVKRFGLHSSSIEECLEPEHLPKYEHMERYKFMILRAIDMDADRRSDSVQRLTNKLAIFYSDDFIVTFHRIKQPYVEAVIKKFNDGSQICDFGAKSVVVELINQVASTYDKAVEDTYRKFEGFEAEVFNSNAAIKLQQIYLLKRRASIMHRMLKMMDGPISEMIVDCPDNVKPQFQTVREHLNKLTFQLEEVRESLISLLNLHVSFASHRTNEVMRVLTIFSVFLMPLNFIAGVYGMNFEYMPELKSEFGYPLALGFMVLVAAVIYLWFRKKGWLRTDNLSKKISNR